MLIAFDVVATVALKVLSGYCGRVSSAVRPAVNAGRHLLRHLDEDPHLVNVGDPKQLGALPPPVPLPALMSAPISVSRAVTTPSNGRDDLLEVFERLQPIDLALIGRDLGDARRSARARRC